MNLGLNHPDLATEFFGRDNRFVNAETRDAAGGRYAKFSEDFFCLVLVDFHRLPLRCPTRREPARGFAAACSGNPELTAGSGIGEVAVENRPA
jgi:hypothetical protein